MSPSLRRHVLARAAPVIRRSWVVAEEVALPVCVTCAHVEPLAFLA